MLTLVAVAAMYAEMEEHGGELNRLVAAAQRGDDASRSELLRLVRAGVLRYLLARGLPEQDAQDLAQDICLGVIRALPGWQDIGREVWALVFTIARNKIADRARGHAARRDIPMGHDTYVADLITDQRPGPAEIAEDDENTVVVRNLLDTLPSTQREVLLLRVIVGLSAAETATALSLTTGSVRVLQHRAITTLRNRLATTPGSLS